MRPNVAGWMVAVLCVPVVGYAAPCALRIWSCYFDVLVSFGFYCSIMRWQLVFLLLWGFSLGDELGFRESLSNVEATRRRSADTGRSSNLLTLLDNSKKQQEQSKQKSDQAISSRSINIRHQLPKQPPLRSVSTVPPFRPIAGAGTPANLSRPMRLTDPMLPGSGAGVNLIAVPSFHKLPPSIAEMPSIPATVTIQPVIIPAAQTANRRYAIVGAANPVGNELTSGQTVNFAKLGPIDPSTMIMGHTIQSLAKASNISVEALMMAIKARQQQQQQILQHQQHHVSSTLPTTTVSTTQVATTPLPVRTTAAPIKPKYALSGAHKVMNAPKEYYPVSYDKNFDDNFTARVELPETSFSCGDQKHFPGLYADEDLGCMVFHVCAFTDDGLVMKSFLCPESTLFDQTILKCNWWFYVDCKASKKLYDSNIPVSKSYQLMKALAFFSSYNSSSNKDQNLSS